MLADVPANLHSILHNPFGNIEIDVDMKTTTHQKKAASRAGTTVRSNNGKLIASKLASTAGVIQRLNKDYGLSQSLVVRMSGYSPRSIASWSHGTKATKPAALKFTELERLFSALAEISESRSDVVTWLQEPNEAFDGSTPLQVIERGESDRIWRMIYFLRSGEPS